MIRDLEPKMVNLIAALIEKITGILVEDKEEVILYLVEKALRNMDRCDEYLIKVSKKIMIRYLQEESSFRCHWERSGIGNYRRF